MDETLLLLHAPLGVAGSGRVRYGAAMELFRNGVISEAQLDAYRDASPHDGRDPAALLTDRGLPAPPPPSGNPAAILQALFVAAVDYLDTLSHPGAAEVRSEHGAPLTRSLAEPHVVPPAQLAHVGKVGARLHHRLGEETARERAREERAHELRARRGTPYSDILRVATKGAHMLLHPLQRRNQIE